MPMQIADNSTAAPATRAPGSPAGRFSATLPSGFGWIEPLPAGLFSDFIRAPYPRTDTAFPVPAMIESPEIQTLRGLLGALHAYDEHTSHHSIKVEALAVHLAEAMGIDASQRDVIRVAAVLHDIGKIGVPIQILAKPARLTAEEFAIVKRHPSIGARILEGIPFLKPVIPMVLHHHEWYNGRGYQHGLAGEDIPLGARIIQAADCIDAMMSPRSYKAGYETAQVISELKRGRAGQFDPNIADAAIDWLSQTRIPHVA